MEDFASDKMKSELSPGMVPVRANDTTSPSADERVNLAELEELVGTPGIVRLCKLYLENGFCDGQAILDAAAARNVELLRQSAHKARGLFLTMRVQALSTQCSEFEALPDQPDWQDVQQAIALFRGRLQALSLNLRNLLQKLEPTDVG